MELKECLNSAKSIIVHNEGKSKIYLPNDNEFALIMNELEDMLNNAREMPALGVSLDDSTRNEMKLGVWVEVIFDEMLYHNDMPFEGLLINVVPDYMGFNIIRKYDGKYEGRCFYIDLMNGKTMQRLFDVLITL